MNRAAEAPEAISREKEGIRSLPRSVKIGLLCSTVYLITLEADFVQDMLFQLKTHAEPRHLWYILPVLIFLPWYYCVRSIWLLRGLVAHEAAGPHVSQVMVMLAATPAFSYLLFSVGGEFVSAVSKLK